MNHDFMASVQPVIKFFSAFSKLRFSFRIGHIIYNWQVMPLIRFRIYVEESRRVFEFLGTTKNMRYIIIF